MAFHSKLYTFNNVVDTYKKLIDCYYYMRPNVIIRYPMFCFTNDTFAQICLNSVAYTTLCTNEKIEKYLKGHDGEEVERLIGEAIDNVIPLSEIVKKENLSNDDVRKQIRNCLAHAHFCLVDSGLDFDESYFDFDAYYVKLENKSIRCIIPFDKFLALEDAYYNISRKLEDKTDIVACTPYSSIPYKNLNKLKKDLEKYFVINLGPKKSFITQDVESVISNVRCKVMELGHPSYAVPSSYLKEKLDDLKEEGFNYFDCSVEDYPEDKKMCIYNYVRSIGINNWDSLPNALKESLISYFNHIFLFGEKYIPRVEGMFDLLEYIIFRCSDTSSHSKDELIYLKSIYSQEEYTSIFLYPEKVLELSYYVFNFSKESMEGYNDLGFNFYFDNIDGVKNLLLSNPEWCKLVYPKDKINSKLGNVQGEITAKVKALKKSSKTAASLQNPKNLNPNKKQILANVRKNLSQGYVKVMELREEEAVLMRELDECVDNTPYYDCSGFFRHLRNSLSHPDRHRIIYDEALEKNDFSKIKYNFIDDGGRFNITVDTKQLMILIDMVGRKVNSCYTKNSEFNEEIKNVENMMYEGFSFRKKK